MRYSLYIPAPVSVRSVCGPDRKASTKEGHLSTSSKFVIGRGAVCCPSEAVPCRRAATRALYAMRLNHLVRSLLWRGFWSFAQPRGGTSSACVKESFSFAGRRMVEGSICRPDAGWPVVMLISCARMVGSCVESRDMNQYAAWVPSYIAGSVRSNDGGKGQVPLEGASCWVAVCEAAYGVYCCCD